MRAGIADHEFLPDMAQHAALAAKRDHFLGPVQADPLVFTMLGVQHDRGVIGDKGDKYLPLAVGQHSPVSPSSAQTK